MLTIQPNFRNTAFRGESILIDKETYEQKQKYYQDQKRGFEDVINDEHVPETMKKGAKVFKVASEGILEGWAVAWGATRGLKLDMVKNSYKWAKNFLKPAGKVIGKGFEKLSKFASENIDKLAKSDFVQKMDKNPAGHYVVEAFKWLGKVTKSANERLKNIWTNFSSKGEDVTYDKVVNKVSKTLGVSAGLGGAYNAARTPNRPEKKPVNEEEYSYEDEVDEINDSYDNDYDIEDED